METNQMKHLLISFLFIAVMSCKKEEPVKIEKDLTETWTDIRKNNMVDSLTKWQAN